MTATQPSLEQLTLKAREHIAATLPNPFCADTAVLFLLDADGRVRELSRHKDVYDGLRETSVVQLKNEHIALGVFTTGWAAPLTDATSSDCAPSQHPDRVRVQLCTTLDRSFYNVSVLLLEDRSTPMVENDGQGSLADALAATFVMMLRQNARRHRNEHK
jgi:hypothetical protein